MLSSCADFCLSDAYVTANVTNGYIRPHPWNVIPLFETGDFHAEFAEILRRGMSQGAARRIRVLATGF
jgi:hypothetical protein